MSAGNLILLDFNIILKEPLHKYYFDLVSNEYRLQTATPLYKEFVCVSIVWAGLGLSMKWAYYTVVIQD